MMNIKFLKVAMLGMCLSFIPLNVAMASPANNFVLQVVDEQSLIKQGEVDKFLFEDHKEEIAQKGITITHTVPLKGYVEIGITPYSEDNANYLLELLGTEMIQIVDADAAVLYDGDDTMMSITAITEEDIPVEDDMMSITVVDEDAPDVSDQEDMVAITSENKTTEADDTLLVDEGSEKKELTLEELAATSGLAEEGVESKESNTPIVIAGIAGVAIILAGVVVFHSKKNK